MWHANSCMTNMTAVRNGMWVLEKLLHSFQENPGSPASYITAGQNLFYFWAPGYFRPCSCFSTFHIIVKQFRLESHLEVIWSNLLCKAGLIRVGCSDSPPVTFQTHPRLETPVPVWAVCSSSSWRKQILQVSHWNSQHPTCWELSLVLSRSDFKHDFRIGLQSLSLDCSFL